MDLANVCGRSSESSAVSAASPAPHRLKRHERVACSWHYLASKSIRGAFTPIEEPNGSQYKLYLGDVGAIEMPEGVPPRDSLALQRKVRLRRLGRPGHRVSAETASPQADQSSRNPPPDLPGIKKELKDANLPTAPQPQLFASRFGIPDPESLWKSGECDERSAA